MRLFTCLPIAPEIRANVAAVQERLAASGANVKWVEPENWHLTITFIGDIADPSLLPDIEAACQEIAKESFSFRIRARGISVFPRRGENIKTVFMDITTGTEPWKELVRRSEPWMIPFGAKREGGLVPHLTLGRVRGEQNLAALKEAITREVNTDCGEQAADQLTLVESVLDPRGAIYTERGSWRLGAG